MLKNFFIEYAKSTLKKTNKLRDVFVFLILMSVAVILSVYLKNEITWDFTNYHYYNVWAFLNDRLNWDIVPASFTTFLNPLMDFPLYFYIQLFNDHPNIIWALQGIWGGLMLFCVYKICVLYFDFDKFEHWFAFIGLCIIILTSDATGSQLGSSSNEIPVAFLILWGVYLLLKMLKFQNRQTLLMSFVSGLIMGIGLGLKQTVITYCLACGLTLIICYKYLQKPIKSISVFALGGFVGYLIINGYFMYKYYVLYGNPFFPFLNGVFHSPYFDNFNYQDIRFTPSVKNFLFFPFMWHNTYNICSHLYSDIRLTLWYVVIILTFVALLIPKCKNYFTKNKLLIVLFVFVALSFFLWLFLFSFLRYAVVIEVVGAIFFFLLINAIFSRKYIHSIFYYCFIIFLVVFLASNFHSTYQTNTDIQKRLYVEPIRLPANTLVKIYGMPGAGIVPFLENGNKNIRATGHLQFFAKGSDFAERGSFKTIRDEIETNHKGMKVFLYYNSTNQAVNLLSSEKLLEKQKSLRINNQCLLGFNKPDNCVGIWQALIDEMSDNYVCKLLDTNIIGKGLYLCVPKGKERQIFENLKESYE